MTSTTVLTSTIAAIAREGGRYLRHRLQEHRERMGIRSEITELASLPRYVLRDLGLENLAMELEPKRTTFRGSDHILGRKCHENTKN
jgi:hypothetical protein